MHFSSGTRRSTNSDLERPHRTDPRSQTYSNLTLSNIQAADPTADEDVATKSYVDSQISSGGVTGDNVEMRLPTDSTFGDGAYLGLTSTTTVTNAIDELNEVLGNVQAGTYIKSTSFVADETAISAGDTVTLTITQHTNRRCQHKIHNHLGRWRHHNRHVRFNTKPHIRIRWNILGHSEIVRE